jgi:hypothetical protein
LSGPVLGYLTRPGPWNDYNPPVVTKRVRVRGDLASGRCGSVLINLQSLLDYIEGCPDTKRARQLATSARQAADGRVAKEARQRQRVRIAAKAKEVA